MGELYILPHLFIDSIKYLFHYGLMDIYFIVLIKANTTYLFCCSNCSSFGHWELFLWPLSFWHNPIIVGFLSPVLLSGTARCSCVFPVPVPKSAISLGSLVPLIGEGYYKAKSGYQLCLLLLDSLRCRSKELYVCILITCVYTHL